MLRLSPGEGFVPFERAAIEQSIPRRFAQQVAAGPDRLAVKFRSTSLTYAELDRRADRVARAILARGIRAEPVAVVVEQGLSLLPAILGILKTGGSTFRSRSGWAASGSATCCGTRARRPRS